MSNIKSTIDNRVHPTDVQKLLLMMSRINIQINNCFIQSKFIKTEFDRRENGTAILSPTVSSLSEESKDELKRIYKEDSQLMYHLNVVLFMLNKVTDTTPTVRINRVKANQEKWNVIQ
jgi:hypothetical protein